MARLTRVPVCATRGADVALLSRWLANEATRRSTRDDSAIVRPPGRQDPR
jgi:hypothetical protein